MQLGKVKRMVLKQIIIIVLLSSVLGLGGNFFSPNKIDWVGQYRSLSGGDGPIVPPTAEAGDPPFIAVDVAEMEHSNYDVIFVDARDPQEFECGTIPGSINIPFESLPEENVAAYIDSALNHIDKGHAVIVFCSGEECDLSLHLARNMQMFGYTDVAIFFGGAREWEKFGLPVERRRPCDE